jgi:hypothetical protein
VGGIEMKSTIKTGFIFCTLSLFLLAAYEFLIGGTEGKIGGHIGPIEGGYFVGIIYAVTALSSYGLRVGAIGFLSGISIASFKNRTDAPLVRSIIFGWGSAVAAVAIVIFHLYARLTNEIRKIDSDLKVMESGLSEIKDSPAFSSEAANLRTEIRELQEQKMLLERRRARGDIFRKN